MQLIIFSGIQASGKSTFYREHFYNTHIRINLDMLKTRHRENLIFQACIASKTKCVIDNTNPTSLDRAKYIQAAKQANFEIIGYFFEIDLETALKRNRHRVGKALIPDIGIISTYKKLEILNLDEGFDAIYTIENHQNK